MASIKCGNCKQTHDSVIAVRACYMDSDPMRPENQADPITQGVRQPGEAPGFYDSPVDRIRDYAQRLPNVATAYYAVIDASLPSTSSGDVWKFYRVDRPQEGRWAGYTFVKVQAGDNLYPVKRLDAVADILKAISFDPQSSAEDYGHQLERCGLCARTLTNPDSRERGIGPVCAEKVGW